VVGAVSEVRVEDSGLGDPQTRSRSGSFGSNLRRLFSPSKSSAAGTRRGGSLNRPLPSSGGAQGEPGRRSPLPAPADVPPGSQLLDPGYERPARQSTPVPSTREPRGSPLTARR